MRLVGSMADRRARLCPRPIPLCTLSGLSSSHQHDETSTERSVTLTAPPEASITSHQPRSLTKNAIALFGGQVVGMVAPLIAVPYLARVLGPEGWAPVIVAQGLANWITLVLEFGFDLSGTRA